VLAVNWEEGLFFQNGRLASVAIQFKSVLDTDMSVDQILLQWNLLREFLDVHGTGSEVGTPFQYNFMTDTADTLNSICSNGLKSMVMSLLLSFLVLIVSSASYKLAVLALISLVCTTATSMSMMVWLGWSFGVMEAICVTILVGLVVDYVVHIGHSYSECPLSSVEGKDPAHERLVRVTYALEYTGISVAGGALTTVASSVVLMFGKITFFAKFGIFMASTSFLSFIFSVLFFPALLCEFGPTSREPPRTCTAGLFAWVSRRMGYQLTEDSASEQHSDVKSTLKPAPFAVHRASLVTFVTCIVVLLSGLAAAALHCSTGPAGLAFCPVKTAKEELVDREIRWAHRRNPALERLARCMQCLIRFPAFRVPGESTTYECHGFDFPTDRTYHITKMQALIDQPKLVHHIILYRTFLPSSQCFQSCVEMPTGSTILYAWALGAGMCRRLWLVGATALA
jgi:hypothetical protein